QQGDEGGDDGAVDVRGGAELLGDRVPGGVGQEGTAEAPECWESIDQEEDDNAQEQQGNDGRERANQDGEDEIAAISATSQRWRLRGTGNRGHEATKPAASAARESGLAVAADLLDELLAFRRQRVGHRRVREVLVELLRIVRGPPR